MKRCAAVLSWQCFGSRCWCEWMPGSWQVEVMEGKLDKWNHKRLATHYCRDRMDRNWVACNGPYFKRIVQHCCISCFPRCCDKIPEKQQLNEGFIWSYSSRGCSPSQLGKGGNWKGSSWSHCIHIQEAGESRKWSLTIKSQGLPTMTHFLHWGPTFFKHATVFPDITSWRSSVQIHDEPMGDTSHQNHRNYKISNLTNRVNVSSAWIWALHLFVCLSVVVAFTLHKDRSTIYIRPLITIFSTLGDSVSPLPHLFPCWGYLEANI